MPSSSAYRSRFGSLLRAYRLVGYSPARDYDYLEINRVLRAMHPQVVRRRSQAISDRRNCPRRSRHRSLDGEPRIHGLDRRSVDVSRRCPAARWKIRLDASLRPDITVAIRMDAANRERARLLPAARARHLAWRKLRLREENGFSLDAFRFDTLDPFFYLAARTPLGGPHDRHGSEIRMIPIDRSPCSIPASRNKRIFQELVTSIAHLGLKKPITVSERRTSWLRPRVRPGPTRGVHRARADRDPRGGIGPPRRTASS